MSSTSTTAKLVYTFGAGRAEGASLAADAQKALLGGKGQGLAEMNKLGVPVPPGFTITTEVCTHFYDHGNEYPAALEAQVRAAIAEMEQTVASGAKFGDASNPLLVSVRSGARVSMPGMMDTVLNLGMNDAAAEALARQTGSPRFAYDSYRRFVQMYGDVVLGLKPEGKDEIDPFEAILEHKKEARGVRLDTELSADDLKELVKLFKAEVKKRKGRDFPDDAYEQLWGAVGAVFGSWNNPRAVTYRDMYSIPGAWGTAVTVQAMVFGNLGDDCATGVAATCSAARAPALKVSPAPTVSATVIFCAATKRSWVAVMARAPLAPSVMNTTFGPIPERPRVRIPLARVVMSPSPSSQCRSSSDSFTMSARAIIRAMRAR